MMNYKLLLLIPLISLFPSAEGRSKEPYTPEEDKKALEKVEVEKDASLPNVLIWGDSISVGYTRFVIPMMKGKANVRRIKDNAGDTNRGIRSLKKWLGKTKWDVIHFNHGLHDLCYRHPKSKVQGRRDKKNGKQAVPLEQYEKNLEKIVRELKKTGARLIWASTTVIPEGEAGRFVGDDKKYNDVAAKIMKKHEIPINDLHALTKDFPGKLFRQPGDVHFTSDGYEKIAKKVVSSIEKQLK